MAQAVNEREMLRFGCALLMLRAKDYEERFRLLNNSERMFLKSLPFRLERLLIEGFILYVYTYRTSESPLAEFDFEAREPSEEELWLMTSPEIIAEYFSDEERAKLYEQANRDPDAWRETFVEFGTLLRKSLAN